MTQFQTLLAHAYTDDAQACVDVAICYMTGNGTAEDPAEGVRWLWRGVELGNASAFYNYGFAHAIGAGVARDERAAVRWYRQALEQDSDWVEAVDQLNEAFRQAPLPNLE